MEVSRLFFGWVNLALCSLIGKSSPPCKMIVLRAETCSICDKLLIWLEMLVEPRFAGLAGAVEPDWVLLGLLVPRA